MREIMCFFAHQGRFGVGSGCQARPRRAVAEMPQPWTGLRATQTKTLSREAALSRSCRKRAESVQKMCRIFWLRSLACRLMCGVLTASKMSSTTPGSPGKIPQARRRRARRRAPRKAQKPTQSIRTVGVPNTSKTCTIDEDPGAPTPKLGSQRPRRWRPSDADARSPRPLSAAETAIAAGPFAEGVLSTARRGPCRLSGRAPSSHQVAVTAAVQADFWGSGPLCVSAG